jgi:hypothetical protein
VAAVLGVPILDKLLGGVRGRLLLVADPGTDGPTLIWQAAAARLAAGKPAVYIAWDRSPDRVRAALTRHGASAMHLHHLTIVDCHSGPFDAGEEADHRIDADATPRDVADAIRRVAEKHPDAWAYVDSLSGAYDRFGGEASAWTHVREALGAFPVSLALFTRWPYLDAGRRITDGFDGVLRLEAIEDGVIRNQSFRLDHVGWRRRYDRHARVLSTRGDHVDVIVPKLVVTGPDDAGKTTFVQAVSAAFETTDRNGTTVAMDRGRYEQAGLKVEVWGTPGQPRFDALLDNLLSNATGVILLVDAAAPKSFDRARELLARVLQHGLTLAVVANKQDRPGAITAAGLRDALAVPARVPVLACRANDANDAREALVRVLSGFIHVGVEA